jgi:F-type H+-transporting ATPase subunit alpha
MKFDELQGLIKTAIKKSEDIFSSEVGYVMSITDSIAKVTGLLNVQYEEIVEFSNGIKGQVVVIEQTSVSVLILGNEKLINESMEVKRTGKFFTVQVNENLIGKVLNGFGEPLDGTIPHGKEMIVENDATPMLHRSQLNKQLVTGIRAIDWLTPIGYGQREVVIGNRSTGKTSILTDMILSLKNNKDTVSIYVSVGQRNSNSVNVLQLLRENNVKNFILIVANGSDSVSMRYLAPFVGAAIGEYFMEKGMNAVLFIDDLTQHAISYREISLTLKRTPGREAYPGDIFYLHSRLLERAAYLSKYYGGGSLTMIPVVEIFDDDVSSYISTNVISIVDGQVVLGSKEFSKNIKPAVRIGTSVSRVGKAVQNDFLKKLSGSLKLELSKYEEYEELTKFGMQISPEIEEILKFGRLLKKLLCQVNNEPTPMWKQLILLYAATKGMIKNEEFLNLLESIKKVENENLILQGNEEYVKKVIKEVLGE